MRMAHEIGQGIGEDGERARANSDMRLGNAGDMPPAIGPSENPTKAPDASAARIGVTIALP
jgi:hypothetical protein